MNKLKTEHIIAIIGVIIAIIGIIYSQIPREFEITIYIKDADTGKNIPGEIRVNDDKNPTRINQETGTTIFLKKGSFTIHAVSEGYYPKVETQERIQTPINITMERITARTDEPLSFYGWDKWNDELTVKQGATANEIIVSGKISDSAGVNNNSLPLNLQGKTLVLFFSDTGKSQFTLNRMVKLTYNKNDSLLRPVNENLINGEYIPARDTPSGIGIEYIIPGNFDGKLGLVFYQVDLKDLSITAWYK
ncbi:MAG: hypothetical protein LBU83_13265 [Bacteroidales bacterium]|jgi:hypothetical protein|nr:hypothetical protein [Bacteroidales bacterium]